MKYVAVTVVLVSDFFAEAADPWRFFPIISLSVTQNLTGVGKILQKEICLFLE
jgi:hypothetical protein